MKKKQHKYQFHKNQILKDEIELKKNKKDQSQNIEG
jgi:hypothetical protein